MFIDAMTRATVARIHRFFHSALCGISPAAREKGMGCGLSKYAVVLTRVAEVLFP